MNEELSNNRHIITRTHTVNNYPQELLFDYFRHNCFLPLIIEKILYHRQ
jgi:hypothetical protein